MSKSIEEMISVNIAQAKFYDSIQQAVELEGRNGYEANKRANWFTRAWAALRSAQQAAVRDAGIEKRVRDHHESWIKAMAGGDFLEVGCFSGSPLTLQLVENCAQYCGVDLSEKAISALNSKLHVHAFEYKAKAVACDFLTMSTERKFDLIYAHGVLHHFENSEPLFAQIHRLAKPGAILIFVEPVAINPIYRAIRYAYRPYQSDAAWEWPFSRNTVFNLEKYFTHESGFGWGKWSLPFSVLVGIPGIGPIARRAYQTMARFEVQKEWSTSVWYNSMVAAAYRAKSL